MNKFFLCLLYVILMACSNGARDKGILNQESTVRNESMTSDSLMLVKLRAINKSTFIGQSVGFFLSDSIIETYKDIYFVDEPPGVLDHVELRFSEDVVVVVRISEYKYLQKFNPTLVWSLDDLKKEALLSFEVVRQKN